MRLFARRLWSSKWNGPWAGSGGAARAPVLARPTTPPPLLRTPPPAMGKPRLESVESGLVCSDLKDATLTLRTLWRSEMGQALWRKVSERGTKPQPALLGGAQAM